MWKQVNKVLGKDKISNIRLVYDEATSKPKGFGYIEFIDQDILPEAIQKLKS